MKTRTETAFVYCPDCGCTTPPACDWDPENPNWIYKDIYIYTRYIRTNNGVQTVVCEGEGYCYDAGAVPGDKVEVKGGTEFDNISYNWIEVTGLGCCKYYRDVEERNEFRKSLKFHYA